MVPEAHDWPHPRPLRVTLRQRQDFTLHFLISAVIAAEAGTPLADAVGLWKELADARRGGSGFSFNDLAADRAGTRFGERAVRDAGGCRRASPPASTEADFMPPKSATCPSSCPKPSSLRATAASAAPPTSACSTTSRRASPRCRFCADSLFV